MGVKETLSKVVKTFKKTQEPMPESVKNMNKTREAAQKVSKELKAEKE